MKYKEIFEQIINEINMSPASLRSLAADINAQAGMEFEMIVPGAAESEEGDDYSEADYSQDEGVRSIQDAYDFFYDGDFNGRRDVERLRDQMREKYQEWLGENSGARWDADKEEMIYDWLRYNAAPSDVFGILGVEANNSGDYPDPSKEDYRNAADKVAEDQIQPWYEDAEQDFQDNFYRDADMEDEWLEYIGIETMADVESNYNITWPHYHNPDTSGGGVTIQDAAESFAQAIGREVKASDNYHSRAVTRPDANNLHYVVEPDGSLEADDDSDGGLEFVSPALPINELLDDLKKVKAWADKTGCYTNDSTGLHINVSVPNWKGDMAQLDYVKLAVLMGDEYVLNEFGRSSNTYAKSALIMVKDHIAQRPEDTKALLDKMRQHLNTSAAKAIHSGSTSKYTSINTKTGYIEFRSPGGDWLNDNFDKIENTLYRFVVALDAAVDENKYKQEYAKKLYKLLAGNDRDVTNTMVYFARYAAGELPQAALKSFIKQAQFERSVGKEPNGTKMWYRVDKEGRGKSGASVEVVATSKEEALQKAASEWSLRLSSLSAAAVYPVRPFDNNADNWEVYNERTGEVVGTFKSVDADGTSNNYDSTGDDYRKWRYNNGIPTTDPRSLSRRPRFDKNRYELFLLDINKKLDEPVPINVTTDEQALTFLDDYIRHGPHRNHERARTLFGIRRWGDSNAEPILAQPFRATSGEPQPAGSVGQEVTSPTGQWKVVDGLGRELHRFTPTPNTQARANELGELYGRGLNGNYSVLPVGRSDIQDIEPDLELARSPGPRLDRPFVWKVQGSDSPYQRQGVEVIAYSEFEAMQKAIRRWNLNIGQSTFQQFFTANGWVATPVRPAEAPATEMPPSSENGTRVILDARGNVLYRFHAPNDAAAEPIKNRWCQENGIDPNSVRLLSDVNVELGQPGSSVRQSTPVPGSTTDLQQQRAAGGAFTGAWKILDTDTGQELYRFSGIGNSQADANRVAADWLRQNAPEDSNMTQIEVVPIMR